MRTRWSARAARSAGTPCASPPKTQATGPGEHRAGGGFVQVELAARVGGQQGEPGGGAGVEHGGGVAVAGQRQVEDAAGGGPHRLAVVRVDGVAGEHHRVGARGVGHPDHRADVARVGDAGADGHQRRVIPERGGEGDVEQVADRHEALRRDGVGQRQRRPGR